jgi:CHAD domain-containing protein
MDFQLHRDETLPEGLRRLAAQQLDQALAHLEGAEGPEEEQIHEARKSLKRLRALVCLARAELGPEQTRWELRSLGLTARLLAGARDAAALVECLDQLDAWSAVPHPRVRGWLEERKGHVVGGQPAVQIADALRWAQVRLEQWPLGRQGWEAIGPGLRWVYARGRRAMNLARTEGGEERYHQWRRYAKYWWYHTQVLRELWPPLMEATQAALDRVGEVLGADHDLAMLAGLLQTQWPARRSKKEVLELAALIPRRQAELQAEALALGSRLYAEGPRALERRWGRYWEAWRGEDSLNSSSLA